MRERDLRHQQQHVAPGGEGVLGGGEEDLRLAAARDAVQQEGSRVCGRDGRGDGVERAPLGRCERGPRRCGFRTRRAPARAEPRFGQPGRDQRPYGRRVEPAGARRLSAELTARRGAQHPVGAGARRGTAREGRFLLGREPAQQADDAFAAGSRQGHGDDGGESNAERTFNAYD